MTIRQHIFRTIRVLFWVCVGFGAIVLMTLIAYGQTVEPQTCAVQVVIDLQTYDGPQHFENLCLSQPAMYGDGLLSVEAVSMGDGLFKDGFDPR